MELTTAPLDVASFPNLTKELCVGAWKRFAVNDLDGIHGPLVPRPLPFIKETEYNYRVLFPLQAQVLELAEIGEIPPGVELGGHFFFQEEDAKLVPHPRDEFTIVTPVAIPLSEIQLVSETTLIAKSCFTLTAHMTFLKKMEEAFSNNSHGLRVERIVPQKKNGEWEIIYLHDRELIPVYGNDFFSKRKFLNHLRRFISPRDIPPGEIGISPFPSSQMILHKKGSKKPLFLLTLV